MNILLPIETINRELDFKLVLSSLLAEKGHRIYVGQHDFLMKLLPKLKNGVYIGKNIFHNFSDIEDGRFLKEIKNKGIDVIYLHEEGAVFKGDEEKWKETLSRQYNLEFFNEQDVVCLWGDFQKTYDETRSQSLRLEVTGHPRFDLYKEEWQSYFESEIQKIKEKYGNYILINGNYGLYNHGLGLEYVLSDIVGYHPEDPVSRMERIDFINYTGSQCLSMVQLTHYLSITYPDMNFVYRPHPSENQNFYETVFKDVKNIFVNHDGAVSPWILASQAIIHDGCTTALEASLAGKPVINYKPVENIENDIWLPNQLGIRCETNEEVKEIIDNLKNYSFKIEDIESEEKVKSLVYNFGNDSFAKLISLVDEEAILKDHKLSLHPKDSFIKLQYLIADTKRQLYLLKNKNSKQAAAYHKRKFYGFDKTYIKRKVDVLEKMLDKKIDLKYHNSYLIEIK